jgi:hypothetical protein
MQLKSKGLTMKKVFGFILMLICFTAMGVYSANPTDRVVDASYVVMSELHLKGLDTLAKTGDTIKLLLPQTIIKTGDDMTLVTGKISQLTGVNDSIGAAIWLLQYDDSLHLLQEAPIDTISDSLSENIKIPVAKYPAKRYGIQVRSTAGTFSGGVKMARAKLIFGHPVNYQRND